MTTCVFVGPTLSRDEVLAQLDAICLPPVAQGDVWLAVRRHAPHAIGIIDGFFAGAPAVWHKEILWAMSQGVAVYGSASMGALRAAELDTFGMRGVGRIYEAFRDGELEDDDEVAVTHGPAELGYLGVSEAMVNIRETLAKAEASAVLRPPVRLALERCAKSLHFAERSWPDIMDCVRNGEGVAEDLAAFEVWLATNKVNLKRDDALAMLETMRNGTEPPPAFRFEPTHFWAELVARLEPSLDNSSDSTVDQDILDELRVGPQAAFDHIMTKAFLRFASESAPAGRSGVGSDEAAVDVLRSTLGLYNRGQFETWLARQHLDETAFRSLASRVARLERLASDAQPFLQPFILDELRLSGDYARLAERAFRKRIRLSTVPSSNEANLLPADRLALRIWFARRLPRLEDAGLAEILKKSGFADAAHLDRALYRERLYQTLIAPECDD